MVGLDIFFLAFISGASMNPARSLAPALLSGVLGNLWLYWTATYWKFHYFASSSQKVQDCQYKIAIPLTKADAFIVKPDTLATFVETHITFAYPKFKAPFSTSFYMMDSSNYEKRGMAVVVTCVWTAGFGETGQIQVFTEPRHDSSFYPQLLPPIV